MIPYLQTKTNYKLTEINFMFPLPLILTHRQISVSRQNFHENNPHGTIFGNGNNLIPLPYHLMIKKITLEKTFQMVHVVKSRLHLLIPLTLYLRQFTGRNWVYYFTILKTQLSSLVKIYFLIRYIYGYSYSILFYTRLVT